MIGRLLSKDFLVVLNSADDSNRFLVYFYYTFPLQSSGESTESAVCARGIIAILIKQSADSSPTV
jgi:hypothetical protein